jgi:hypothetical protein
MEENATQLPEKDIIALPLTHEELVVLMRCLVIASESERIDETDRERAGNIKGRIARFAERQGAWWDHP